VIKGPRKLVEEATGDSAKLPLLVLFLLNMVDELDQVTYGIVAPEIRDTFGVKESTIVAVGSLAAALVIMLVVPVGYRADRHNRVRMVSVAAVAWGSMTVLTGLSGFVGAFGLLILARFGAGLGRVMNEPVHVSLLADYYPPVQHGRIYSLHRSANAIGGGLVLLCALLADIVGWRVGFILLAVPTFIAWTLLTRLHEPVRGASIDQAMALRAEEVSDRVPFTEAWRRLKGIPSLKRGWWAGLFIGASVVPIAIFLNFFFEQVYDVESITARGAITTLYYLGSLVGLRIGSDQSTKALMAGDLPRLSVMGGITLIGSAGGLLCLALAPWIGVSIFFVFVIGMGTAFNSFGLPVLAAVAPPRLRSQALGYFVFFIGLGALLLSPIVAGIGEEQGYRFGIAILSVLLAVAGIVYASAKPFVRRDAEQAYNTLMLEAGIRSDEAAGKTGALLTCRGVEVAYGQVQVLFGVDLDVMPGEIVALLGTNGAGKSTLLRAISGTTDPIGGAIFFEGRDVTHSDPGQTAALGIVQVPGGKAVFPTLTVAEHLRAAGWLYRDDPAYLAQATEEVLDLFPRLRERIDQLAGNLSGGEQQMLALGMAFIAKPKLLIIDELSLGLAPTIVEQLLVIVRRIQQTGTAILLVEQSINVALTLAERAYFMEKGEVRFEGPTAELLQRDDIVRSVFLDGAAGATGQRQASTRVRAERDAELDARPVVLEVEGLSKRFGGIRAVNDTSFHLREGEILGLIGPNGAGKTTIFDLVSGFIRPDAGRITFDGVDITNHAPDRRAALGLGRSFQDARLVPSLTVAENLAIGLERHLDVRDHFASLLSLPGVVRLEEDVAWTVADLVELMHLGAFRDKFVRELSTGSRRIVDLAMCIAHDPKVLLLDEPSSGIAQKETEALGPLLRRIQDETGCALLVIEHDMPLITGISDRMVALELGHPIVEGTPQEVTTDPQVVASYLGGDLAAINRSGTNGSRADGSDGEGSSDGGRRKRKAPLVAAGKEARR
jgi:ABC-type branched-subunit amino acid transport system ATPase component/predicted MFS family arabinose efflux permease